MLKKQRLTLSIGLVITASLFILLWIRRNASTTEVMGLMKQQMTKLNPMSGDILIDTFESTKPEDSVILRVYSTSSDFETIKKEYDAQFSKLGFRFIAKTGGSTDGQQGLVYCNKSLDAEVVYSAAKPNASTRYTVLLRHYNDLRVSIRRGIQLGSGC